MKTIIHVLHSNHERQNMSTQGPKKSSQEDWHPADIKAALQKRGTTLSRVALDAGLTSSSSLSACLARPMPANEKRIAAALGMEPATIWPSRYNADGTPKLRGIRAICCSADEMRARSAAGKPILHNSRQALAA